VSRPDPLPGWTDLAAKRAVLEFVERTCGTGPEAVPAEERVAVFDNDGTLWCEKPMPIQLDFIIRRLVEMGVEQPELRERQPWKASHEKDYGWFGRVMAQHYAGNDADLGLLAAGVLSAHGGISVEAFEEKADRFLRSAQHPTLGRPYLECLYAPMLELIGYLQANGFSCYIASGGGRDFMRPISADVYGIPREQVIGSSASFSYADDEHGGTIMRSRRPTTSTTGPRSRSASGAAPGGVPCSPRATPTATCRCCDSPTTPTNPHCAS
jgi:phosphoserine phosphatase